MAKRRDRLASDRDTTDRPRPGFLTFELVRKAGLEPARLAALEPKSSASTSSATFATARPLQPMTRKKHLAGQVLSMWWAVKDSNLGPID
jgi:hypothetical protein